MVSYDKQKGHSHEQPFLKLFFLVVFFLLKEHMQSYEIILRVANNIKKKVRTDLPFLLWTHLPQLVPTYGFQKQTLPVSFLIFCKIS